MGRYRELLLPTGSRALCIIHQLLSCFFPSSSFLPQVTAGNIKGISFSLTSTGSISSWMLENKWRTHNFWVLWPVQALCVSMLKAPRSKHRPHKRNVASLLSHETVKVAREAGWHGWMEYEWALVKSKWGCVLLVFIGCLPNSSFTGL